MKQIILIISLTTFFLKPEDKLNENYKLEEVRTRHSVCKEASLSKTYLVADIMGEEPRISVFTYYYNECMGF